jgi:hypothetical protein
MRKPPADTVERKREEQELLAKLHEDLPEKGR